MACHSLEQPLLNEFLGSVSLSDLLADSWREKSKCLLPRKSYYLLTARNNYFLVSVC